MIAIVLREAWRLTNLFLTIKQEKKNHILGHREYCKIVVSLNTC